MKKKKKKKKKERVTAAPDVCILSLITANIPFNLHQFG